jgi:hypothetical protein
MSLSTQKEIFQAAYQHGPPRGSVGWHRSAFDADVDNAAELICEDGGFTAHLAADDLIQAVSSAGGDTSQTCYVRGIDTNDKVRIEAFALNGATAVDSAAKFRYVESAWLSSECAGAITIRRKTGPANILSITIGQLQSYAVHHFNGELTTYLTGLFVGGGGTLADSVNLALRHYPDDADSRDLTDGFVKVVEPTIFFVASTVVQNPPPIVFPQPIRIPSGSYIALYGTGEAANNDVWAFLQGFDIVE